MCRGVFDRVDAGRNSGRERGRGDECRAVFTSVRSAVCSGDGLRASREMRPCVAEVVEEEEDGDGDGDGDDVA